MSPTTQKFVKATVPSWVITLIVTVALGMLSWAAVTVSNLEARVCVQEDRSDRTARDINDIKANIKDIKTMLMEGKK